MSVTDQQSAGDAAGQRSAGSDEGAAPPPTEVLVLGALGDRGGVQQYIQEQCDRLGDDVDVSTYDLYAPGSGDGLAWLVRTLLLTAWALVRFPFRRRPDVVHVHSSYRFAFYRASPYVLIASYVWRRPVVVHVHGSSFDEFVATDSWPVAALQSVVFDACDRIVVLSAYWREVLSMRADEDKLVVLPNAVDPEEYDPQFDADPPRIVFVSTLIERKGVPAFVEAVDLLAEGVAEEFAVDVAGDGPLADRVEDLAARREGVSYWGYVSEARKRELLSEGTIYVLPTHAENLPIAMLEGMAGGNAVVATPVGGIPDVVGPDNGYLVEPGNPDDLAGALSSLLSAPRTVEGMARRNRELIVEEYDWGTATDRLLDLYDDLARS